MHRKKKHHCFLRILSSEENSVNRRKSKGLLFLVLLALLLRWWFLAFTRILPRTEEKLSLGFVALQIGIKFTSLSTNHSDVASIADHLTPMTGLKNWLLSESGLLTSHWFTRAAANYIQRISTYFFYKVGCNGALPSQHTVQSWFSWPLHSSL